MTGILMGTLGSYHTAAAGSYELISTTVLGASAASVTLSGIPSTYKHLQLRWTAKGSSGLIAATVQFNADSTASYHKHQLYSNAASGTPTSSTTTSSAGITLSGGTASSTTTSFFSGTVMDILDYSSTTKNKTIRALSASTEIYFNSGVWPSTAAISSIDISLSSGTFIAGCRFSVYGIKG